VGSARRGRGLPRLSDDVRDGSAAGARIAAASRRGVTIRPRRGTTFIDERVEMTTKDKNARKSMEKKPAQKTLKEKRQAKRAKK
jgi:hypothetical protein